MRFGLIIPIYNSEKTLARCLNSVLSQTCKDILVCCVDDGSTDNSYSVLNEFKNKFSNNFICLKNRTGIHGPSIARNIGLEKIRDRVDYITFLDSDDYIDKNYFEVYSSLIKDGVDIVCGSFFFTKTNNEKKYCNLPPNGIYQSKIITSFLLEGTKILSQSWGKFYKSSLWKETIFPERTFIYEDYATLYKIFLKADTIKIFDYCGYHYVLDNDSLLRSKQSNKKIISIFDTICSVYCDKNLDNILKKSAFQFFCKTFLSLIPYFDFKKCSLDEKHNIKFYIKLFSFLKIKSYKPQHKNDKKKKIAYLLLPLMVYTKVYKKHTSN